MQGMYIKCCRAVEFWIVYANKNSVENPKPYRFTHTQWILFHVSIGFGLWLNGFFSLIKEKPFSPFNFECILQMTKTNVES